MNEVKVNGRVVEELTVEEVMKLHKLGYEFVVEDGVVTHVIQN